MRPATFTSETMATVVPETDRVLAKLLYHVSLSICYLLLSGALKQVVIHPFRSCPVFVRRFPKPLRFSLTALNYPDKRHNGHPELVLHLGMHSVLALHRLDVSAALQGRSD
jgi:hypothetical protein